MATTPPFVSLRPIERCPAPLLGRTKICWAQDRAKGPGILSGFERGQLWAWLAPLARAESLGDMPHCWYASLDPAEEAQRKGTPRLRVAGSLDFWRAHAPEDPDRHAERIEELRVKLSAGESLPGIITMGPERGSGGRIEWVIQDGNHTAAALYLAAPQMETLDLVIVAPAGWNLVVQATT